MIIPICQVKVAVYDAIASVLGLALNVDMFQQNLDALSLGLQNVT
jgi:hypothetical protein